MSHKTSEEALAEIRDVSRLRHLRLRPRNQDGSLDLRCKANKGFERGDGVTAYFDPQLPHLNIKPEIITALQSQQQEQYDALRFKELTEKLEALQASYGSLLALKVDDVKAFRVYQDTLKKNRVKSSES